MSKFVIIPDNFDPSIDFDHINPQIKFIHPFSELHASELNYSDTMWCIVMYSYADESANKIYRLPPEQRLEAIQRFYKDFDKDVEVIKLCIKKFPDKALNAVTRALTEEKEVLTLRGDILKDMYREASKEKDLDTLVKLDKLIANNSKFWDNFEKVETKYMDSKKNKSTIFGGRQETFAEKGKL